jgi:hypothetical protein
MALLITLLLKRNGTLLGIPQFVDGTFGNNTFWDFQRRIP